MNTTTDSIVSPPSAHHLSASSALRVGCAAAALGLVIVGASVDALTLGAGTALAACSFGLRWIPCHRAAKRMVLASRRDQVLSIVSTGTTFGTAAAGALALLAPLLSMSWRTVWFRPPHRFPASLALALLAAAPTGASTMIVCAALSFWSLSLHSPLPALGFDAVVVSLTLGSVVGPALGGVVHGTFGAAALFAAAALSVLSAIPPFAWRLASGSPARGG